MLDPEGRVSSWNPGAERIKGYTAEEILGEHFSRFYTPEDQKAGIPQQVLRQATAEGHFANLACAQRRQPLLGSCRSRSDP